jgi:hypothetical protein
MEKQQPRFRELTMWRVDRKADVTIDRSQKNCRGKIGLESE